jgi:hypothetical protein
MLSSSIFQWIIKFILLCCLDFSLIFAYVCLLCGRQNLPFCFNQEKSLDIFEYHSMDMKGNKKCTGNVLIY